MSTLTILSLVLVGDPVEHRGDRVARAAPLGPEVDDHLASRSREPPASKVALVASTGMKFLSQGLLREESSGSTSRAGRLFPVRTGAQPHPYNRRHVHAAPVRARLERARARDPRPLGARGDLRAAPQRRTAAARSGRFIDGPVTANKTLARAHGVGADAQGRLPALQGAARLRPALPERLRLPGALDRGRGRASARAQLEARDRGVRARGVRRGAAATSSSGRPRS